MSAFFVVRAQVHDWEIFKAYADASPKVLAKFGGRHIARGGKMIVFEGREEPRRIVIAEFPDFETAERCYNSPEYQAIIPLRKDSATLEFLLVDGVSDLPKAELAIP